MPDLLVDFDEPILPVALRVLGVVNTLPACAR